MRDEATEVESNSTWDNIPSAEEFLIDDCVWEGRVTYCVMSNGDCSIGGSTGNSINRAELTTAIGASFRDHPDAQTNLLAFNGFYGAGIVNTAASLGINSQSGEGFKISKLQVFNVWGYGTPLYFIATGSNLCEADGCIFETNTAGDAGFIYGASALVRNSLFVKHENVSTHNEIAFVANGATAINCTFVHVGGGNVTNGILGGYAAATLANCAVVGALNIYGGTAPTVTTSYTDLASAGGFTGGIAFDGTTFADVSSAIHDLKLVTGSPLIDVGTDDATYAYEDIVGTARPQGSATDVGAWEFVSGGGGGSITGSGALAAGAASADGAGVSLSTGTGALLSGPSSLSGVGGDITGTGVLEASSASVSGSGTISGEETGHVVVGAVSYAKKIIPLAEITGFGRLVSAPSKMSGRAAVNWDDQNTLALLLIAA